MPAAAEKLARWTKAPNTILSSTDGHPTDLPPTPSRHGLRRGPRRGDPCSVAAEQAESGSSPEWREYGDSSYHDGWCSKWPLSAIRWSPAFTALRGSTAVMMNAERRLAQHNDRETTSSLPGTFTTASRQTEQRTQALDKASSACATVQDTLPPGKTDSWRVMRGISEH